MSDPSEPAGPRVAVAPEEPSIVDKARAAPVTFAILALNVAGFLWVQTHGGSDDLATSIKYGVLDGTLVWAGEYWRLVSYMFMHGGWMHILMNMYVLIGWGPPLERALGKKRFLLLYMLSGLAAGCASLVSGLLFAPHRTVGASGALFGIIGAFMALRRRQLGTFQAFFADKGIRSILVQIGLWTAIGSYALHLDNAAHLGGFVSGFAIVWVMTSAPAARRKEWLALAFALGGAFILAAHPWMLPRASEANELRALANSYLTGKAMDGDGNLVPWPHDVARGESLLEKGCSRGAASSCDLLADHVSASGAPDAASRAAALRQRTCELDPGSCQQLR
ncbi:MAG: rhomboid family serine protease [Labilithrix sp.]|nr:rhomboid family serine protease [Labilithrix sp.]